MKLSEDKIIELTADYETFKTFGDDIRFNERDLINFVRAIEKEISSSGIRVRAFCAGGWEATELSGYSTDEDNATLILDDSDE